MQHQKVSMSKKKFRIGDLAKELRLKKYIIRFWEKEFDLESDRSEGGQRFYTQEDLDTFSTIKELLYAQGYTISGAKKQLNLKGATVVQEDKLVLQEQQVVAHEACEHSAPQEIDEEDESADKLVVAPREPMVMENRELVETVHHEVIGAARKEHDAEINPRQEAFLQQLKHLKAQLVEFKQQLN